MADRKRNPTGVPEQASGLERGSLILVVDDDEVLLRLTRQLLLRLGFEVLTAPGGAEGLELLRQHGERIGCVLLDVVMPGMDGREAFVALRALQPRLPIVITTGFAGVPVDDLLEEPPAALLQKPYRLDDLRAVLHGLRAEA